MINFKKCLFKAKEMMPNYEIIKYTEYENYYLFLGINSEDKYNRIAINKVTCNKKEDWESSDLVLDKAISKMEEDIPSSF